VSATAGRRAALRGEAGVSLVELLVTILVTSIVLTATVSLVLGVHRVSADNEERLDRVDEARTAVESMARNLRSAVRQSQLLPTCEACTAEPAVVSASGHAVVLYTNVDNAGQASGPRKVSYTVATSGPTAGQLVEVEQEPDSATPGPTGFTYCTTADSACTERRTTRVLASGVRTDGGVPLFTYWDATGAAITGTSLSATQRERVVSVELSLRLGGTTAGGETTTYIQRVLLPNAQTLNQPDEEGA
jgi:type II secretory pathway pseudopilin PulG